MVTGWKGSHFLLTFPILRVLRAYRCHFSQRDGLLGRAQAVFTNVDCWNSQLLLGPCELSTGILGREEESETLKVRTSLGMRKHALKFKAGLDFRQVTRGCS